MSPDEAYTALRTRIISGQLQPNERLVEADLAVSLGAGRAAVRTALIRLEQERLVEREHNRGARVRLVSIDEAIEIVETRSVLEGLIARRAAARIDDEEAAELRRDLARLADHLDRSDLLAASDANSELHRRISAIAHHHTAERLIATLHSQMVRFQYRTILIPGRSQRSFAEHSMIVDAIVARDPDAAEAAMRSHLSNVADSLRTSAAAGAAAQQA